MKITEKKLRELIRENMALRMTQDRMRNSGGGSFSEPRSNKAAQKRKGSEPITRNHIVKNSFKGTSSDRNKLAKDLKVQIEKMIASGKEDQIPSNWRDIIGLANGDQLLALKQAINPGMMKKLGRFLGLSETEE
jgi:ribosomal protein L17